MRCKKGDLAIVEFSRSGNEGKIVRCVEFIGDGLVGPELVHYSDLWRVEPELPSIDGGTTCAAADRFLRPLPGGEGVDEMLLITGHPLSQSHREKVDA